MPVTFKPIANGEKWAGASWVITDEDALAKLIARVALGQSRHVAKILRDTGCADVIPSRTAYAGAREILTVATGDKTFHRDGWLFQVISWVAANKQSPNDLIRAPQMIKADKGFDGIHVRLVKNKGQIATVIICEEKATINPRNKIVSDVWPDFESLEAGERDNELVAAVTDMLAIGGVGEEVDEIVASILWKEARSYRVSVTGREEHCTTDGLKRLFEGYEDKVAGNVARRRAEVLRLDDIRKWLSGLANKALAALDEIEAEHV